MEAITNISTLQTNNNTNTNTTTVDGGGAAASLLSLDPGSWFVLAVTLCVFFGPLFVLFPPFPPRRSDALWQTHTKLGLRDNDKTKKGREKGQKATTGARLQSLCVYPVESLAGIEVARAKVSATGLEFDRLFALAQLKSPFPVSSASGDNDDAAAKAHKWEAIAPRQFPRLRTVQVELWQPDLAKLKGLHDKNAPDNSEAFLILRFPWREPGFLGLWDAFAAKCLRGWRAVAEKEVLLPVAPPPAAKGYARDTVVRLPAATTTTQEEVVEALDMSVELPEELRLYLGVSNKLGLFRAVGPAAEEAAVVVKQEAAKKKQQQQQQQQQQHSLFLKPLGGLDTSNNNNNTTTTTETPSYLAPVVGFYDEYPVHVVNVSSRQSGGPATAAVAAAATTEEKPRGANVFVYGLPAHDEDQWKKVQVKPEASSQDSEVLFRSRPQESDLGVQLVPLFDEADSSSHGFLEVGMSVEVLERW